MQENMITLVCDIITILLTMVSAFSEKSKKEQTKVHPGVEIQMQNTVTTGDDDLQMQKYNMLSAEQKAWLKQEMNSTNPAAQYYSPIEQVRLMNNIYDNQIKLQMMQNGKTKKSMVVNVPENAQPGQTITVKSLEGINVTYTVPPDSAGHDVSIDYYV